MTGIGAVGGMFLGSVSIPIGNINILGNDIRIGVVIWIIFMVLAIQWAYKHYKDSYSKWNWDNKILSLLSAGLGSSFGIIYGIISIVGFLNPYILFSLIGTGLPLSVMLLFPPIKRRKLIAKYRHSEESLIKP